jgi:hypothetical protein
MMTMIVNLQNSVEIERLASIIREYIKVKQKHEVFIQLRKSPTMHRLLGVFFAALIGSPTGIPTFPLQSSTLQ